MVDKVFDMQVLIPEVLFQAIFTSTLYNFIMLKIEIICQGMLISACLYRIVCFKPVFQN